MTKYRYQPVSFRVQETAGSGSRLTSAQNARYLNIAIGDLCQDYIFERLVHISGVVVNPVNFSLVNVYCPLTLFAHGYCDRPPKGVIMSENGTMLALTFAISSRHTEYQVTDKPYVVHQTSGECLWGLQAGKSDFLTLVVNTTMGHDYNLHEFLPSTMEYLYNILGTMTKNFVRHWNHYDSEYESAYSNLNLDVVRNLINMPLANLVRQYPYHFWVFNRNAWLMSNILAQELITDSTALYFMLHLKPALPKQARVTGDLMMRHIFSLKYGIIVHLRQSLMSLVQRITNNNSSNYSSSDLIVAAAQLPHGTLLDCENLTTQIIKAQKVQVLLPADIVANRILKQDNWSALGKGVTAC